MKLVTLPRYVKHPSYRDMNPITGSPAVHAMMRGPSVVIDANAFLYACIMHGDAFYPDEPDVAGDAYVSATFAKGSAYINIETKASELTRVLGRRCLPDSWLGQYGRDALKPRV